MTWIKRHKPADPVRVIRLGAAGDLITLFEAGISLAEGLVAWDRGEGPDHPGELLPEAERLLGLWAAAAESVGPGEAEELEAIARRRGEGCDE